MPTTQPATPSPTVAQAPDATQAAAEGKPDTKPEATFSQADIDRIVKERLAREGLSDLKAKAAKLDELTEAQKTAEQKAAEALAKAQRDSAATEMENQRLRAAIKHGVDDEHAGLIGGTDSESIGKNAETLGKLLADSRELAALRSGRGVLQARPVPALTPGSAPAGAVTSAAGANGAAEAERRFGKVDAK
jgi:hypothetical protein